MEEGTRGKREVEGEAGGKEEGKKRIEELEWKMEEGERERKRNNVVIVGLKEDRWTKDKLEAWIEEKLEVRTPLKRM